MTEEKKRKMELKKNVVERLYVVHAKIGSGKYTFRVKAESEETAKEKAKHDMNLRFGEKSTFEVLKVERIDPDDFV